MELVTKDIGGDWYYTDNMYICKKDNKIIGKLPADSVPDPMKMWQAKCDAANVSIGSIESMKYKSTKVVQDLWEHKNAKHNT